jgi:CRP/FNR family transcriptional regulator, anaerobic regulatory protein
MVELMKYFQLQAGVSEETMAILMSKFSKNTLQEGKFLLRKGQMEDKYYFVERGSFRKYFVHNEKEYIVWIQLEGDFFCEIKSLRTEKPTNYYFQAIESTTYWSIKATEFEQLIDEHKDLALFMRHFWEVKFITALDGFEIFQTLNAKERYDYLTTAFPRIKNLPLQHLAAIVGITQSSLSRIRREK